MARKRTSTRRPERVDLYLPIQVQEDMDRNRGDTPRSPYVASLIVRDTAEREEQGRATLAAQSEADPDGTRRRILGALEAFDGNATRARGALGWGKADLERAIKALGLTAEIARRWPARRASQVKEGTGA